ncbi:transposable element Tcb2 transposase [Trichonephila clavipes]|nr:transposable element Tcb2 transposase [Trichonephila clavipes]
MATPGSSFTPTPLGHEGNVRVGHHPRANALQSDESQFLLLNADGRLRIWRQAHEAMDPACQVVTVQVHGGSVMVRGVSSWRCLGYLVRAPTFLSAI